MTYLSRELIRRMIIAEASKKAPLLPGGGVDFSDKTEDLTDLDLSRIEDTETVDIDKDTKISSLPLDLSSLDLSSLYDDEDDMGFDDRTEQGFRVDGLDDFRITDEESESETVDNPLPMAAHDEKFRLQPDMKSSVDPFGRTHRQIKDDVFASYDDLYEPPTKKSKAQEEAEFLKKMEDMLKAGSAAVDLPEDPEFAPLDDNTLELPKNRFDINSDVTKDMNESIKKMISESVRNKIKQISKNRRY